MPLLKRPCPGCRVVLIASPATRCPNCARVHEQQRGSPTQRGLGYSYQRARLRVLARDRGICWLCGLGGSDTVDHVLARSRGGDDSDDNLRAAHRSCNSARR